MLVAEVGAGPLALARAQRAQTARTLIETTDMQLTEIAFAAGFGSVRQFNETVREVYASSPRDLRTAARPRTADGQRHDRGSAGLSAAAAPAALLEFLALRAIPGVEIVTTDHYTRAIRLPHGVATVMLTPMPDHVAATLQLADVRDLAPAVARCRRLLDLDADPAAIDAVLGADPALAAAVAAEPGVRVPRAVDGFEIAVRAIVGQQISVAGRDHRARPDRPAGAAEEAYREAAFAKEPPRPTRLAARRPRKPRRAVRSTVPGRERRCRVAGHAFSMPDRRKATIKALAAAIASGDVVLDGGVDRAETEAVAARDPRHRRRGRPAMSPCARSAIRMSSCHPTGRPARRRAGRRAPRQAGAHWKSTPSAGRRGAPMQ